MSNFVQFGAGGTRDSIFACLRFRGAQERPKAPSAFRSNKLHNRAWAQGASAQKAEKESEVLLGGSWVVISGVISPLMWVISIDL